MTTASIQKPSCPEDLLPWFVNRTLPAAQYDEVKAHLEHCDRCRQEVAWLQSVSDEIKRSPPSPPGELGLKRLMNRVRNEEKPAIPQQERRSGWWRPALAIAASLIIILQAGLLLHSWFGPSPVALLSGKQDKGVVFQVTFSPGATELQIREAINSVAGTVIGGPGALGVYRMRLDIARENTGAIEKALDRLKKQDRVVTHVTRE